jgi:hypothetical protein
MTRTLPAAHHPRTRHPAHPCASGCRLREATELAWRSGYAYALGCAYDAADRIAHVARVAEAIDDIRHAPAISPARTYEQRIAERLAEAAACAARLHARIGTREWRGLEHGDQVTPW